MWRIGEVVDGRYEVIRVLGQGAMGVVHRVRHLGWGTDLAVKSPRGELVRDPRGRDRFVAEAEAWVSLGLHPHVCGCYYVRTLDGVPRVFAEYVRDGSLRDWITRGTLYEGNRDQVLVRILDLAVQAAHGLEHAHAQGLVHQDVKPANILVDAGVAKVADFGLARARGPLPSLPGGAGDASTLVTNGGLTPAYASPEQALGKRVGRRSDIYSLAVSVLEMFTGEIVWAFGSVAGQSLEELRGSDGFAFPLPDRVASVLARCLAADPRDRPGSMAELAAELGEAAEHLTGGTAPRTPPRAADLRAGELNNRALSLLDLGRPEEAVETFERAAATDPHHAATQYNAGLLRWRRGEITDRRLVTTLEEARASADGDSPLAFLLAQVHLERGDLEAARALLENLAEHPEAPDAAEAETALNTVRSGDVPDARCTAVREAAWQTFPFSRMRDERKRLSMEIRMRMAPDGKTLLTGSWDGTLQLWNTGDGRSLSVMRGHTGAVRSLDLGRDGRLALSLDWDGVLRWWDPEDGSCLHELSLTAADHGRARYPVVRLIPGSNAVLCGTADGRVVRLHRDGRVVPVTHPAVPAAPAVPADSADSAAPAYSDGEPVLALEVSADGRRALAGGTHGSLWLVDLVEGSTRLLPDTGGGFVHAVCLSADGRRALSGHGRSIRLWDMDSGRCLRTIGGPFHGAHSLTLSADGRRALSGRSGALQWWDLDTGRCLRTFHGHRGEVSAVWLSPDAGHALSAAQDNTLRQWSLPGTYTAPPHLDRPRPPVDLNRSREHVTDLVVRAEQALDRGRLTQALDCLTRARSVRGHERDPKVLDVWHRLDGRATRVGLRAGWQARELTGHTASVNWIDLTNDGRIVASASADRTIRLWRTGDGECLSVLEGHDHLVDRVAFSPDGGRLLSLGRDRRARLWDVATGRCLRVLDASAFGTAASFCGDGSRALIAGQGRMLRLWDLDEDRPLRGFDGFDLSLNAVWTTPDGRLAVTGGDDRTVRLWDLDSGRCVHTMTGHAHHVISVWLSPDGRYVLSGGTHRESVIRLWDTSSGTCLQTFEGYTHFGARLTADARFAVWSSAGAVQVADTSTGRVVHRIDGHSRGLFAAVPTPDGRHVVTGDMEGLVRMWELDWELTV
ncbi:protein kinase [Streptomyces sp. NPDC059605]|uniref:protein kinase domain-containing protein n=1 Tax=unclassified Streptomyces TaxID=2593676 RepID=UPI0036A27A69